MQAARTWGLDLPDLRRNPQVPQFAGYGAVFARWGKSSNGSPPTRRTVLTVLEMDWAVPTRPCHWTCGWSTRAAIRDAGQPHHAADQGLAIDGHRLMLPLRLAHLPEAALGHGDAVLCGRFRPWVQR